MRSTTLRQAGPSAATTTVLYSDWETLPALQQPQWRHHPSYARTRQALYDAAPLVSWPEVAALQAALAEVASGAARVLQVGDCAESFYECTRRHTYAKVDLLEQLADRLERLLAQPVVRVGRIGGQYAKPRSKPTEQHAGVELPSFRGHLVNSEVPTRAARQHDPRRMLWGHEASGKVLAWMRAYREGRARAGAAAPASGPWASHEALVLDYEGSLIRTDPATGLPYLGSTHLPWIGERTRQPGSAHARMLATVAGAVGCKIGPGATPDEVAEMCAVLDPDRTPGRLVLISRMGSGVIEDRLPPLVAAARRGGHPVVWLCDPLHGNTVRTPNGLKTRHVGAAIEEATSFARILQRLDQHPGGLHLEAAATGVTECIGGDVADDAALTARYTSLCDPRLNPDQALSLIEACAAQ